MASSSPDWIDTPYVRVYLTLRRDHPRVWYSSALLGWYVRLLAIADGSYPAPAELPRSITDDVVDELARDGIIEVHEDGGYTFRALDAERKTRARLGAAGGRARARQAKRDSGRFAHSAGDPLVNHARNGGPALARSAGDPLVVDDDEDDANPAAGDLLVDQARLGESVLADSAGDQRTLPATSDTEPSRAEDDDSQSSSSSADSESDTGARDDDAATSIDCDDYAAHQLSHVFTAGAWRCLICEARRAASDERFRDKVAKHGGPAW